MTDRWFQGQKLGELAPNLLLKVAKSALRTRTVRDALLEGSWLQDCGPNLNSAALQEFLCL